MANHGAGAANQDHTPDHTPGHTREHKPGSEDTRDRYDPSALEALWQARWDEWGTNRFTLDEFRNAEDPYYNLMMFPYPSAEGLHVGNIYAFTGADVHGRYHRLRGREVFEPIGFDAFGIHSENFALKVGLHPMDLIPKNVANFTRQLRRIGGMFDWDHTVDTTTPEYYRWTQWLFLQLFKGGLAEQKEAPVNWCPSCMTVLANEQVISGLCERCDSAVEQRRIAQWFFRITDFAQRLLDNLDDLDWSETTKKAQSNWIGRSEGAFLRFPIAGEPSADTDSGEADSGIKSPANRADTVDVFTTRPDTIFGATYMVLSPEHPLVDRVTLPEHRPEIDAYRKQASAMDLVARQKTDKTKTGVFTGGHCVNPATGERIPIWIADYVLMEYGTGAIMAVPGHDQRDFEFATKFELPIPRVVAGPDDTAETPLEEAYVGPGRLVNSGPFDGLPIDEAIAKITAWLDEKGAGEKTINYRLHDWCISRQRYWGPPIPIIHCDRCGAVPVPEEDLPVVLPRVEDFKPDDSGISPLARVEEWYRTECPDCGGEAERETDVSDTFLDSAWYFLRYPSTDIADAPFDPAITRRWLPVDTYIGGNEHAVLHLLYARFVTMALHDLGHLDFEEPFTRFRAHGLIIREGAKMSKSKGNVVVPDPIIEEYGADTFRLYLMFLGPFEEGGDYRDLGIQGPFGFLKRLWETVVDDLDPDPEAAPDPDVERKLHQTIEQVTRQLPELQYNTSIAAMMEYLNAVRSGGRTPVRAEVDPLVVLVAPFAPHIAEELWSRLGHSGSLWDAAPWPDFDPETMAEDTITLAVQVNGKVRGTVELPAGASQEAALAAARDEPNVARHLAEVELRRVIHVPDRLLNLVVG
ncbi:MAG: leucine--tRNA ligase [Gemmatimonadales bacterium]|nr:MAG: leucine--tRNA ligase [Gemmatimonadales bacterium]